jgi:hypothetical protein
MQVFKLADEANFLDLTCSRMFTVEERESRLKIP